MYYFCDMKKQNGIFDLNDFFQKLFSEKFAYIKINSYLCTTIKKNKHL